MSKDNTKKISIREWANTLKGKLMLFTIAITIPFLLLVVALLFQMNQFSLTYDRIVKNVTAVNVYNMNFKKDMDSTLYQMIARSIPVDDVESKLDVMSPYRAIASMEAVVDELMSTSTGVGNQRRLQRIQKNLNNLEKRVGEISELVVETGNYDESMFKLNTNIYILTSLIQDKIQEYIYHEVIRMEEVRVQLNAQRVVTIRFIMTCVATVLLLTFYLSYWITRSLTVPIGQLCRKTEQVARGDFETRAGSISGNEIRVLGESFNLMVAQIGDLVDNIRKEQEQNREMELKLLQAQINPHFLYNTLDNILWLAEGGKKDDVASMVMSLSDFFRTTLSKGKDFITLEEEILHVSSYLEIQQYRYRDIMNYIILLPEELKGVQILKMTLQPLVENALYHGLKNKRSLGTIVLEVTTDQGDVVIHVIDNGMGITTQKQQHLRMLLESRERSSSDYGYGLSNIQERLNLHYGKNYGLSFYSIYGIRTVFSVRIPRVYDSETHIVEQGEA